MVFTVVDEVTVTPGSARVYEHGWQSWSATGSYDARRTSPRPGEQWVHQMRFRPGVDLPEHGFQGEGLLVVDPGGGSPARLYGSTDPARLVPSVRASYGDGTVTVSSDGAVAVTTSDGISAALTTWADAHGPASLRPAPTVWCTWYDYFLDVTQRDVEENLEAIDRLDLPVEVVQIDDGWEVAVGDWLELSPQFTSLSDLAARIRDSGRRAGVWLAPFTAAENSRVAADHPDWVLRGGGRNWGGEILGLDPTHPGVRGYVREVLDRLRAAGFDYFKLDFLYTGALPTLPDPVAAYRSGLELVRDAAGADAYLLGCGAPMLPSIGLVDAMRVSPDTFHAEPVDASVELRGVGNIEARAWAQGRLWVNDGDCLVARPSFARRDEWADVVFRRSGLRSFSDRLSSLDPHGLDTVRRFLESAPPATPFANPS